MVKKYYVHIMTVVLGIFIFIATWNVMHSGTEDKSTLNRNQPRIALIAHVKNNPYWMVVKKGAEAAAKERGCILEYYGSSTANVYEDLNLIDMNIAAKVDGLITYVQEEEKYTPSINKAIDKGIPVITVETDAKSSKRISYVGTDNAAAGRMAGEVLWQKTNGEANIGIIMAGLTTTNQVERVDGFKKFLATKSRLNIIATESSNSYELNAKLAAKKIISEYPEVNFLYCTSAVDGIGAAKAIVEEGLQGKVSIICFDDLPDTLTFIKNGTIYASIVQRPYDMGYESVNMIMDKIQGKAVKDYNITKTIVVTRDNVASYENSQKE